MKVRFDEFQFDTDRFELRRGAEVVPLEPQVFDVLAFLIANRERVVTKEEMLDGVWGDRFVSESALTSRIKAVRQALGDDGNSQRFVQTIRGRGYRFVAPVHADGDVPGEPSPAAAPSGIVTFLLSDVEGSTQLWAADRAGMSASLEVHDRVLRDAVGARGGFVFSTAGDSFAIAFARASDAVEAALAVQAALEAVEWPGPVLSVRMGLHLGEADERGNDYFGPVVNLTARLEAAGHGDQVLMTEQVRQAAGVEALDLGSHRLRDVPEPVRIFQLGDRVFPALRIVAHNRTNLPTAPSRMIGRDEVLAEVRDALSEFRLVTLTATGGTGKTRLAIAVGEAELTKRRGGVWFVDLTSVNDGALVPATIAAAVGLVLTGGDSMNMVVDYLGDLDALIVLDNCEHLVDACADFAEAFLARPGTSRILATTREFLDVDGERAIRLGPLKADGASSAAVQLFIDRAMTAHSTFTVDAADRWSIAALCGHLDGSPLAIELAAARVNVMSPAELLAGIGERFELLSGGRRRRSKQTLEQTLDWSYELLDTEEQDLFRALGTFAGSFDLDAVMSIADLHRREALDLIESLVAKSLVVSDRGNDGVRFRLLETTAAYAEDALARDGRADELRNRHLDHYIQLCAPFEGGMWPTSRAIEVLADRADIRAAIKWAGLCGRWPEAARMIHGAAAVLEQQPEDLFSLVSDCLANLETADHLRSLSLDHLRIYLCVQHDFAGATQVTAALEASPHPFVRAWGRMWFAFAELHACRPDECLAICSDLIAEIAPMAESIARNHHLATVEVIAGWANAYNGDNERALRNFTAARALLSRWDEDTAIEAEALAAQGVAQLALGDLASALANADILDTGRYLYYDGAEIRAAAHLARAEIDSAAIVIREHADDAVTGRLSRKANNSLLLLALLAEAEDDATQAARLLMDVREAQSPGVSVSLELAGRLGIRDDFEAVLLAAAGNQDASGRGAIEVLKVEMTRRGWTEASMPIAP